MTRLTVGATLTIPWNLPDIVDPATGLDAQVKIELSRDGKSTWETIVAATDNDGAYPWTVDLPRSSNCYLRISNVANSAEYVDSEQFGIGPLSAVNTGLGVSLALGL